VVIPGDVFGHGWERSLRLSLGGAPEADLMAGLERLGAALGV
jgi:aspartate/methionine/tyrosine aminotransferase